MFALGRPRRILVPRETGPSKRWGNPEPGHAPRPVRVSELRRETADAVTLVLEPEDGVMPAFRAGQYFTHCFEIDGQVVRRAYSLSVPEGGGLACTIKLIPGGWVSSHVHEALQVGSRYRLIGPTGDFLLDEGTGPLRFLAGGSGITPVISLIETALERNPQRDIRLVYASRREADIVFDQRLRELARRHLSLDVVHVLSQPQDGWPGQRGRLDSQRIRGLLGADPATTFYLCGPAGLMQLAAEALHAAGVPAARIRQERFLAAPKAQARPSEPQEILFKQSGRVVTQRPGESILEAGLREGLPLPFSCMVGGCAHCKLQVLEGEVALSEPNCLSPEERAAGFTLACSAYATGPLSVAA
ncbi:ferredoxin--NADP reductase [Solimonas sp. SE-A11]|uniref:ferredoxin--NADP reductase n=1 Tax=Solimonas sp. SE-A11 TaxID=3054954 RepID=UPI00259CA3DB|nr:ferredoxin--NADP reductase [Solimonas sp. SE-A11]MDM4770316.1 ferredoxin--NADP reductase [Solimonas sp. SE-A11]